MKILLCIYSNISLEKDIIFILSFFFHFYNFFFNIYNRHITISVRIS